MSPLTYRRELRIVNPQAAPLTISDDLQAPALNDQIAPARRAINAGLDLALYAQTEAASASAYHVLVHNALRGRISTSQIREAASAIQALKASVGDGWRRLRSG
jgi:beta-glucosidase-like glycosyl hydrolase